MQFKTAHRLAILLGFFVTGHAQAAYELFVSQSGPDVVAVGSGSIDVSALTPAATGHIESFIQASPAGVATGRTTDAVAAYDGYVSGIYGLDSTIDTHESTTSSGDMVGIAPILHRVLVPVNYVSGQPLASNARWVNRQISDFGYEPGSYTWTWGEGSTQDSFTLHIEAPAP